MEERKEKSYSRSALADALDLSLKEVTEILLAAGWILQDGDNWQLTAKGEFEGGFLRESKKYGNYLAWPESVLSHPIFKIERDDTLSASDIGKSVGLSPRLINLLLEHCQWMRRVHKGWQLTAEGLALGGVQHENPKTGVPWVSWPQSLLANDYFQSACVCLSNEELLSPCHSLNGIEVERPQTAAFLSWCYLSDVVAAQNIANSKRPNLVFDFFLPKVGLYIDIWDAGLKPQQLAERLERPKLCETLGIDYLVLQAATISEIEEELPRELLKRDYEL
ncbi:hypothetical protein [Halioxenophilus sp. WMMB6]|uniref:hypothetical protein n=1 Tax=Halioxenophilus sp. WMMB6 TaxID=3073815 RepID=UPI00295E414C|nr:hypothetical protein [Halioxenophilus sp. WMMB6]